MERGTWEVCDVCDVTWRLVHPAGWLGRPVLCWIATAYRATGEHYPAGESRPFRGDWGAGNDAPPPRTGTTEAVLHELLDDLAAAGWRAGGWGSAGGWFNIRLTRDWQTVTPRPPGARERRRGS